MLGDTDDEAVKLRLKPDLAAQPAIGPDIEREVEHIFFHRGGAPGLFLPRIIDIDVAGCATARAAAFGYNAGHGMLDRCFHHGLAFLAIDRVHRSTVFYVSDFHLITIHRLPTPPSVREIGQKFKAAICRARKRCENLAKKRSKSEKNLWLPPPDGWVIGTQDANRNIISKRKQGFIIAV